MNFRFYQPTRPAPKHAAVAVFGATLSELIVRPGTVVSIGLWGTGYNGDPLEVRVYRGGTKVNGSPASPVKLNRTKNDPTQQIQEFQVTGLKEGDSLIGVSASGRARTHELPVFELRNTPSGLMREASNTPRLLRWSVKGICPDATPYLSISDPVMGGMAVLKDSTAGGPLINVHGLAVHTTAGNDVRTTFQMTRWGCVEPWNKRGVSAHFGVSGDGTLVQFVSTAFVSYAQYSPGNEHWISVEIDNNGKSPMNPRQLASTQKLFRWIANTYGVPNTVATGCLFPEVAKIDKLAAKFDEVTTELCDRADVETTTDAYLACMSRGVSCHWWLEGRKTSNSHGCPGAGILNQLDAIASG